MGSDGSLSLHVNGRVHEVAADPTDRLIDVLRDEVGVLSVKEGCGTGQCGACTVLLDGKPVTSCLMLCADAVGHEITTVEGLARDGELHPLQKAFLTHGAVQCGFCTPGMVLAAKALLDENPKPTDEEIRRGLVGNLCRCTGYRKIVEAIRSVAQPGGRGPRKERGR